MLYLGKACFMADDRRYAFTRVDGAVQVNEAETGQVVDVYYGHAKPATESTVWPLQRKARYPVENTRFP